MMNLNSSSKNDHFEFDNLSSDKLKFTYKRNNNRFVAKKGNGLENPFAHSNFEGWH